MKEIIIKGIDEKVYYGICDNGLKVYIWVNDLVASVNMSLAVNYGSVHTNFTSDGKKISVPNGIAHFLEHVKFNETPGVTAHDFFLKTGAEVNAFTTFDYTSYYVNAIDKVEENLNHLLDFVQTPYFTKELIEKEKGIILEEAKMGMDNPDTVSYFAIFENLFNASNYKNLITGTLEDIKKISLKDVEVVYENFYHPENMALFITGNVNPYELLAVINSNQNKKEFKKYLSPKINVPKENLKVQSKEKVIDGNVTESRVKIGVKIKREVFKDYSDFDIRLALNLALNINFGSTSELKNHLIENHLASKLMASADIYDDYVVIVLASNTRFPKDVIKILKDALKNLSLDKNVFLRKQKAIIASYILNYDSVDKVNEILQDDYINYGEIIDDAKEKFESLNIKIVEKMLNLIDFENITEYIMNPKEENK